MGANYAPGVVVGMWFHGRGTWVRAFGTSRMSKRLHVGDVFRLGSITKSFTGTVVLQLVQEGKLSLGQPLSDFFPSVPNAGSITIRNLLNHTSGIPDTPNSIQGQLIRNPHRRFVPDQLIAESVLQPYTPFGIYSYSNTNYLLLGRIVEMVTHHSLSYELTHRVLRPLHLTHTSFQPNTTPKHHFAHGYAFVHGRWTDVSTWTTSYGWAAASMLSSVPDLKRYAFALATGRGLLSPAMQAQRLTFVPTGIPATNAGLGIFQFGAFLGHDGGIVGYNTVALYAPSLKATLVILMETTPELLPPPGSIDVNQLVLADALVQVALAKRTAQLPHGVGRHYPH